MPGDVLIAFVGDSLTADGRWDEWFPDERVLNAGVRGETSEALLDRLDAVIAECPDVVSLLAGTNDLAWRQPVEHVVRNLELALHRVRHELPGALILVQSVLPREEVFAARIRDINVHLRQFAPTVRARYLDLWPALAAGKVLNPSYSDDGVTLNERGYEAWLAELRPALQTLRERPPTTGVIELPGLAALHGFGIEGRPA